MIIGIPKEIKDQEFRVALTPTGVRELCARGHEVWVETKAGEGSEFPDEAYQQAGAQVTASKEELFSRSELVLKVKEPLLSECSFLSSQHTLFTFLHLAPNKALTESLLRVGLTAIAYETVEDSRGSLPLLVPMSEIAGRMATQIGAQYLSRAHGGRGVVLGGVPGVTSAQVVVLGAGTVGSAATRIAVGLGARVTVISVDLEQLRGLDALYQGRIVTLAAHAEWINQAVTHADLVIGAVMIRGGKTPQIVPRSVVRAMAPRSVIVDVAVDQGGCVETTRPTTHSEPIQISEGVIHYGVTNIPGVVPQTSTHALTNATLPFIIQLAELGVDRAITTNPGLAKGVNIRKGAVTCQAVAEAHGLPHEPLG